MIIILLLYFYNKIEIGRKIIILIFELIFFSLLKKYLNNNSKNETKLLEYFLKINID